MFTRRALLGAVLVVLLVSGAAGDPVVDDDLPSFQIRIEDLHPSREAQRKGSDFLSDPDWGVIVEAAESLLCVIEVDESTGAGEGTFDLPTNVRPTLTVVDVDLSSHDVVTERVPLALESQLREIRWRDGSEAKVAVEPFDAEASSGSDAHPTGAQELRLGETGRDSVEHALKDRTDYWKVTLAEAGWVEGFVYHPGGNPSVAIQRGAKMEALASGSGISTFRGRLPAGTHLLRVRAVPQDGATCRYGVALVSMGEGGRGQEVLVGALLDLEGEARGGLAATAPQVERSTLAGWDSTSARSAWIEGLRHPAWEARVLAIQATAGLHLEDAIPHLERLAKEDRSEAVRAAAADALVAIRAPESR